MGRGAGDVNGIAVYKDNLYWSDARDGAIYFMRKYASSSLSRGTLPVQGNLRGVDIVIVDRAEHTVKQADSPCAVNNGQCTSLCVEVPGPDPTRLNRTCLCSESFAQITKSVHGTHDEQCNCAQHEVLANGTCSVVSNATACADNEIRCANLRCVRATWKCDHDNDCGDMSDERDCPYHTCRSDQFTCQDNGHCIPLRWKCDRDRDCLDGSDEADDEHGRPCVYPNCTHDQFTCDNGRCIPHGWVSFTWHFHVRNW